ncbi:MAG: hypothetical protein C0179_05545, partial [Fervidicoccus sp.]
MESSRYFALFNENDVAYIHELSGSGGGSRVLTIDDLRSIDLNALVTSLHGITDPIGQLKDWLYNVLKELASWFADTVSGIVRDFWDKIMSPAISVIRTVVDSIYAFITNIPGAFTDMISWIRDQFRGLWSWVQDNIAIPLVNFLNDLSRSIQSGISTLRSTLSSALDSLLRAVADAWDYIQRNIVSSVADAFSRFVDWIQGALSSISRAVDKFFSETLPMWLSQAIDNIQKASSYAWDTIQRSVISPLLDALNRFGDWVRSGLALVSDFFTKTLPAMLSQVGDLIQRNIVTPLADAFSRLLDALRTGLGAVADFFTKTLPGWLSQAWDWLQKSLSGAWDWIQRNIISPLLDALGRFGEWIRSGLETVISFFTKILPEWIDRSWRWIQDAFAGAWRWIQDHIITPLWS